MSKRPTKKRNPESPAGAQLRSVIESWEDVDLQRLNKTQTAQVFISSLNGYPLKLSAGDKSILSDFRKYLAAQIEKNFRFMSADINEDWPALGAGNPKQTTEYLARTCHVFICILVDSYGFTDDSGLSATIIELDAAYKDSPEKMLIFIQHTLRDTQSDIFKALPLPYQTWLNDLRGYHGKLVNFFESWDELPDLVLKSLDRYSADTLRAIRRMPAYASDKSSEEANWEQMTFRERYNQMLETFRSGIKGIALLNTAIDSLTHDDTERDPERYQLAVKEKRTIQKIPVVLSACPDRFSYPDAAAYVGYPFRTRVESWKNSLGPLDIVLFFRTITDAQIRRHLGNPDIHVTREEWGYFAADPERYIQVAYLINCTSSRDLERKVRQFLTWLVEYEQVETLLKRARIRGRILLAENEARSGN
jgi:hypothetical protein